MSECVCVVYVNAIRSQSVFLFLCDSSENNRRTATMITTIFLEPRLFCVMKRCSNKHNLRKHPPYRNSCIDVCHSNLRLSKICVFVCMCQMVVDSVSSVYRSFFRPCLLRLFASKFSSLTVHSIVIFVFPPSFSLHQPKKNKQNKNKTKIMYMCASNMLSYTRHTHTHTRFE